MILFDTNIFIYSVNKEDERFKTCRKWIEKAEKKEIIGIITPQNITELSAVITNLAKISKKFSRIKLDQYLNVFLSETFTIAYPNKETLIIFSKLLKRYNPIGRKIYDLFLISIMLSNNIKKILTYNTEDFKNYKEIKAVSPF